MIFKRGVPLCLCEIRVMGGGGGGGGEHHLDRRTHPGSTTGQA